VRHEDPDLLKAMAGPGECELCGRYCERREAHHAEAKGMGAGKQIDAPFNLVSVGRSDDYPLTKCRCHRLLHDGNLPRRCVISVIALREKKSVEEIEQMIRDVRDAPKKMW